MEKKLKEFDNEELDKVGFNLYEQREQLLAQLNAINQQLMAIRAERSSRVERERNKDK